MSSNQVVNLFKMNKLNLCHEELLMTKRKSIHSTSSPFKDNLRMMNHFNYSKHICNQSCDRSCDNLMAKSMSNMFNTLPNNRDDTVLLIESKQYANLNLSNEHLKTSNFSNFSNYKAFLDSKQQQRSKYFDVYHPKKEDKSSKASVNSKNSNSLCSSQSSSSIESCKSETDTSATIRKVSSSINLSNSRSTNSNSRLSNSTNDEVRKYNLHSSPFQFDFDKVHYVKTVTKAKSIVDKIEEKSKVIALNCDSDCCLQNGIDLFEVAVIYEDCLDHPDIYVFDIHLEPKIIDLFKPIFANSQIVKVMFDARLDLRILSRKYGIMEFTALFDIQLAYRVLLAKLTNRSFEDVKREKLLYVSWQCNGPLVNFEKMHLPSIYKNSKFWQTRPINFEIMFNAAYDVFVMVPQLFTNLVVIMERTLDDEHQKLFIKKSDELIASNLLTRKFAFFHTKHQYLDEMHRQIDLLIQSDILFRNKQSAKWQQLIDDEYEDDYQEDCFSLNSGELLKNQINEIDTDSYLSFSNSDEDLMNSIDGNLLANEDLFFSHNSNQLNLSTIDESGTQATSEFDSSNDSKSKQQKNKYCDKCKQMIKNDRLSDLLDRIDQSDNLKEILFTGSNYCQCTQLHVPQTDEDAKCMNLLVDQIIDLAECKEDYMELED